MHFDPVNCCVGEDNGRIIRRRDASDHYSLIDEGTAQVAFEGSSLDEIQSILVEVRGFDLTCEEYGLGEIIVPVSRITINNEALLPIELNVVLLAAHFSTLLSERPLNCLSTVSRATSMDHFCRRPDWSRWKAVDHSSPKMVGACRRIAIGCKAAQLTDCVQS